MLKHNDVIARLTDSQKVRLLTGLGNLSGKDFKILGLPGVKACNLKDYGRSLFPHRTILSHAWNEELWYNVAEAKAAMLAEDGGTLAIVPGAKIKLSPFRREVTEDPHLASRFSVCHASAVKSSGLQTALAGYYLTESDVAWMDKSPSPRIIHEFVTHPYEQALKESKTTAIATDVRPLLDGYKEQSRSMQDDLSKNALLICESAGEENTVDFIARGIVCLHASANALESAMKRYKKLKRAIEKGEGGITLEQMQSEQEAHTAISEEAVDIAVDNAISFMMNCTAPTPQPLENVDELALTAAIESSVLLKNQNDILPLSKSKRVALIGSILPEDEDGKSQLETIKYALTEKGYSCVGTDLGYDMSDIQKNHLIDRAVRLADSAGVVILFLGFGSQNEKNIQNTKTLELPANQLHLADALIKRKKTVIGIISAGHAPDIAFTRNFKAVLLAPLDTKASARAIVAMLTGEASPSGKLAYTLYAGSTVAFQKRELYKQKYNLKSGPFVGYRYYDTANVTVGYPFGHGLSYTSFAYTDLSYTDETVTFTVENKGHMPASEVAQIYIGANASNVLRPKKELCGFIKLHLAPQERKKVSLPIDIPKIYQIDSYVQERGEYTIFVGASSMDIRLSKQVRITGQALQEDGEAIRHYIQSVPNLLEDHFTLEAKYHPMKKKSQKNLLIGLLTLILAIGLATFNTATELYSTFIGVVGAILGGLAIFFVLSSIQESSKDQKSHDKLLQQKNKEYFQDAEQLEVLSTQKMFSEEFDAHEEIAQQEIEMETDTLDAEISKYVDTGFKLSNMVTDLRHFCEERGFKLDAGVAENIVTSLVGSKLLILEDISSEDFNGLMLVLSEYFATKPYVDKIEGEAKEVYDLFFSRDHVGDAKKKASVLAMEDAARAKEKIHLLCVDGLTATSFETFIKPFTTYITSQKSSTPVKIFNNQGANIGFNVLQNLKLIIRLADDVAIDALPTSMLRVAACASIAPIKCQVAEEHSPHHGCNRYQLEYMYEKESSAAVVSENVYKKVDKLESYVASHCDYRIGNKLWLAFEKQIGLLLSAKKETAEAVDSAVATKLLPSMMASLNGHLTKEDESLQATLEFIFGEENIAFCAKLISAVEGKQAQNSESE